ncbi:hypothetical protein LCGC14_3136110 [marine sediment metagenome]|uniref:Uncharacterized protein n=1 Tax=marine sediment metagenome TaxID=412755 RepID=A0A0F8VY77_9ZZZZ
MIEITFRHDGHVTKNCYRFEEIDTETNKALDKGSYVIGKLYIQKHAFHHQSAPDEITVKVEW